MLPRSVCLYLSVACCGVLAAPAPADDWPQWLGPNRDGVWKEAGVIETFPKDGLKPKWRAKIGPGYSGPAVAKGLVVLMDRVSPTPPPAEAIKRANSDGSERVIALDAKTGAEKWVHEYECAYKNVSYSAGPRTTPVIDGDRVYTLGTMGDLRCLDIKDGKAVWKKNFVEDYKAPVPAWGWSAHLLADGDLVYAVVGGEKSSVVAFDKKTGAEKWKALSTREVGYCPPIIVRAGGKRQLLIWLSEYIAALDPLTGAEFWRHEHPAKGIEVNRPAVNIATPKVVGDTVYVSNYYHGAIALKLGKDKPAADILWRAKSNYPKNPDTVNTVMSSLLAHDGHIYGLCLKGEMKCLKADTGEVVWSDNALLGGKDAVFGSASWVQHGPSGGTVYCLTDTGDLCVLKLSPKGYDETARTHLFDPAGAAGGRKVTWPHPAFADKHLFTRTGNEVICVSLAK